MTGEPLTDLEVELLELCSMSGETTTTLHEEMLEVHLERAVVETALRRLLEQGLVRTSRGVYAGDQFSRDLSRSFPRTYEDDWWDVTPAGHSAIHTQ